MATKERSQVRATFDDTLKAQEKLRCKLDELDKNNLVVPPDDRGILFKMIGRACLGLEHDKQCNIYLSDGSSLKIEYVGRFIRRLIYQTDKNIGFDFLKRYGKSSNMSLDIGFLWHEIKFIIYGIFPEALSMSIRISKEQTYYRGMSEATGYDELEQ